MFEEDTDFIFCKFTKESFEKIKRRKQEVKELERDSSNIDEIETIEDTKRKIRQALLKKFLPCCAKRDADRRGKKQNKELMQGNSLPERLKSHFSRNFAGHPIEELDDYWKEEYVFIVISRGFQIYRFSANNALFILSPLNPIRRVAIMMLTHSALVMLAILVNCFFMAFPEKTTNTVELVFIGIYSTEALIKILARGFILDEFSFLRDAWNWLDFVVIVQAYVTIIIPNIGDMSILRTFRVLRALKTVAVVPGLKTIVDALIQSVIRLKDVVLVSSFILSVYSLVGLQLYMGVLRRKCVYDGSPNMTHVEFSQYVDNISNWVIDPNTDTHIVCGNGSFARHCKVGSTCLVTKMNPDSGYTSYDWYVPAMLSSFRLITQDFWDGLYFQIIEAEGLWHIIYFIIVIFLGSFYLINLILAIVALSYREQQLKAQEEAKAIEAERQKQAKKRNKLLNKKMNKSSITTDITSIDIVNGSEHQSLNMTLNNIELIETKETETETETRRNKKKKTAVSSIFRTRVANALCTIFCKWDCWPPYKYIQKYLGYIVLDPFMDLFIMICITCNTLLLSMDHYNMSPSLANFLDKGNYVFTAVFAVEAFSKLIVLTPMKYFKDRWNIFDLFIVLLSLIELLLTRVKGLFVLRNFRLLRVFKLAKSWPTLNRLISIIGQTVGALGNLTFILLIIVYIFAVLGMQLFGEEYNRNKQYFEGGIPRWSFIDFTHSFMIVFRILCGEWIEPMWDCLNVEGGFACVPFFLVVLVIGNLVVLNLFIGLLLSSFGSDDLNGDKNTEDDVDKISIALRRIGRILNAVKNSIKKKLCCCIFKNEKIDEELNVSNGNFILDQSTTLLSFEAGDFKGEIVKDIRTLSNMQRKVLKQQKKNEDLKNNKAEITIKPCFCAACYTKLGKISCCKWINNDNSNFIKRWLSIRRAAHILVEHKIFESFIIIMIILSSVVLAMEDKQIEEKPKLKQYMEICDHIFTGVFVMEMVLKWIGYGFRKYFTDAWCWLDFIIVSAALMNYGSAILGHVDISIFKTMRILRALRPLRALSRFEGIRVVVNALVSSLPPIFNVMLVCLVFWLIFSIMGVQLFAGKFHKCVYPDLTKLQPQDQVRNKTECLAKNYSWINSRVNFDNVPNAYLALLQIATFSGWVELMEDATDIGHELDTQPVPEQSLHMLIYFIMFVIIGAFFTLNLFIGVIMDNFNQQKERLGGNSINVFLTETQKKYYQAVKKIGNRKPLKALPRPKFPISRAMFDVTSNHKFEIFIMVFIFLNMIAMCCEHYGQSEKVITTLKWFNYVFIGIFTIECVMKILALHWRYFTFPWNVFDFCIVFISLSSILFEDFIRRFTFMSPTVLSIVRVARVGRVLRLIEGTRGVRTLLFALVISLPALLNIGSLLLLVIFIYGIFGMNLFMHIVHSEKINDQANFENIFRAISTLFPVSTSGGWNDLLDALSRNRPPECDPTIPTKSQIAYGNCGNSSVAIPYLVTFVIITFLIIVNMYIAVILENFNQARNEEKQGLTDDDYDMYYEIWQRFDPDCTEFINLEQLSDFVDALKPPLRLPKPNHFKLVSMNLTICEHNRVHCVDILDGLTKNYLVPIDNIDEVLTINTIQLKKQKANYKPITTTFMLERQNLCSRIITRTIRRYIQLKKQPFSLIFAKRLTRKSIKKRVNNPPPGPDIWFRRASFKDLDEKKHHLSRRGSKRFWQNFRVDVV